MNMHRVYERPEGRREGKVLLGVEVLDTGTRAEQQFSPDLLAQAIEQGWMTLEADVLTLKAYQQEDLHYKVLRLPGRYCLHCKAALPGVREDYSGVAAREHVALEHPGKPSPSKEWHTGYEVVNAFECVLDAKQHAKFKVGGRRG